MTDNLHAVHIAKLGGGWSSTAADTEVDLRYYFVSPGKRELSATLLAQNRTASDTGSLTIKMQESATTVDSDFADISGAAFTAVVDSDTVAAAETIYFPTSAGTKYVRSYATIVGTITFDGAAILSILKRNA